MPPPHTLTFSTAIPPSLTRQSVIHATQDHTSMLTQNALLVSYTKTPSPPSSPNIPETEKIEYTWYRVTERIPLIPGISFAAWNVEFDAGFMDVEEGTRTHVLAPMGVELRSYWRVVDGKGEGREEDGNDGWVLEEETELRCSALLTSVCKKNIIEGHSRVAENVFANAAKKMERNGV